ncbi:hypothetical protein, partial [Staphylococcus intermedius]|uniref:hypothetical protein n=1 Tax=Staphylococcus intermedius TaxID=1285 RepID=UPI000BC5DB49
DTTPIEDKNEVKEDTTPVRDKNFGNTDIKMKEMIQAKGLENIDYGSLNSDEFSWLLKYLGNNSSSPNSNSFYNERIVHSRAKREIGNESINFTTNINRDASDGRNKILKLTGEYNPNLNIVEWNLNVKMVNNSSPEYLFITTSTENNGNLGEATISETSTPFILLGNNDKISYGSFNGKDGITDPQWRSEDKLSQGTEVTFKFTTTFNGTLEDFKNLNGTDMLFTVKSAGFGFQRYQGDPGNNKVHASIQGYGGINLPDLSDSESESLSTSESLSESESISTSESLSESESISASESLSESESLSASESLSESESISTSESLSESESISASESLSESESISTSESLSESESISVSESLSESESISTSESLSESESISTSESLSESESISASESLSESESISTSESLSESESISASESLSESESLSASESLSESESIS